MEALMALVRRCSLLAALTIVVTLPAGAAQGATLPAGRPICLPVSATGVGQDLGGGNTQATISIHGVEVGQTNASFTTTQVVKTIASFTGPIVFSSPPGTLTAQVAGTFDLTTGAFHVTSTSITGTGLLRGITGRMTLVGHENLTNGTFTETLTGQLCGGAG
jgi:hypothetical protein